MKDNTSVLEADLAYAVRIVRSKFATVEEAAYTCGIDVNDLKARLGEAEPVRSLEQQKLFESFNR